MNSRSTPAPRLTPSARAALLAGAALAGLAPGGAHAQGGAGSRMHPAPCTGSAPTREALRGRAGLVEESLARHMVELRAAQVAAAGAASAAAGGSGMGGAAAGVPRTDVVQLVPRGYLGMRTLETSDERLTAAGRLVRYCTYPVVLSVAPASPAERAGLQEGDTLIAYNDRDLVRSGEIALDRLLVPGDTVRVSLRRERRPLTLPVVVGRQRVTSVFRMWEGPAGAGTERVMVLDEASPVVVGGAAMAGEMRPATGQTRVIVRSREARPAVPSGAGGSGGERVAVSVPTAPTPQTFTYFGAMGPMPIAGAQFLAMDDDLRAALGVRDGGGGGLLVVRVIPGSPAAEFGLRSGDVIRTADGRAVVSPVDLQRALAQAATAPGEERAVQVELERRGQRKTLTLRWSR